MILATTNGCYVRRDAGIDGEVFFTGMLCDWKAAKNLEATPIMYLVRDIAKFMVEIGKRKRVLVDIAKRLVECCSVIT